MLHSAEMGVYRDAASLCRLIFHLHIAKMKNSCNDLVNGHLITFTDSYSENKSRKENK